MRALVAITIAAVTASVAITAEAHELPTKLARDARGFHSFVTHWSQEYGGLFARVQGGDDRLLAINRSGAEFVVYGYRGERYLRFRADRVVQVNRNAPTTYLNEDRYGQGVAVPASATPRARPRWETVARGGRYAWHDHRIHWMSKSRPPQVEDPDERTEVFHWKIPVTLGPERESIQGVLIWAGKPGGGDDSAILPLALGAGALLLGGLGLIAAWRKRRRPLTDGGAW